MQVFQKLGWPDLFFLGLSLLILTALFALLPACFVMVFWNAIISEVCKGPEINFWQGLLLWGMSIASVKLLLNPEFEFQMETAAGLGNGSGSGLNPNKKDMKDEKDPKEKL